MSQAAFCESLDQQNTTDNRNKSHIKKENCFNSKLYILYIRQKHALNEVTKVSKFTSESCSKRKTHVKKAFSFQFFLCGTIKAAFFLLPLSPLMSLLIL